jgi:Raf kinase inhibitor-like YbhB/YbcL family protein
MRGELLIITIILILYGCVYSEKQNGDIAVFENKELIVYKNVTEAETMKLLSPEFEHNGDIPAEFTCDDADISPALDISGVPKAAKSLVLIMDDPDAPSGTWVHWVIWNIAPDTKYFGKGEKISWPQGKTDFGRIGYGGPCPPYGVHRYFFKLYALDTRLELAPGATKRDVEKLMEDHIIATSELIGKYSR